MEDRFAKAIAAVAVVLALLAGLVTASAQAAGAPINTVLPTTAGRPVDEAALGSSAGKWTASTLITYTYQWERCSASGSECADIAGATSHKYKLQHADVGHTVRSVVTANDGEGTASADSRPTAVIAPSKPAKSKIPTVAGPVIDGKLLAATNGIWKGTPPLAFAYQWKACVRLECTVIPGATESTYRPTTSELGKQLRVAVTATNTVGSAAATSALSKKVVAGPPVNLGAPSVEGTPVDGQTLTASTGSWAGTQPYNFSYQWTRCNLLTEECSPIPGATSATYTAAPLDVGNAFEVTVTATNSFGTAQSTSAKSSIVSGLIPGDLSLPKIGGLLQDGQLLSVIQGVWNGTEPILYSYQWELCNSAGEACSDINGAVGTALSLISPYVGSTVRVIETATNSAGSASAVSEPTSIISALLPSNLSLPSITGLLQDGQLLSALAGTWSGSGPLSFAYQWQLCNSAGEGCKDISGAAETALALISGEIGDTVRVIVTATNSAGSTSAASEPTSAIAALLPGNTGLPSIGGLLQDGQSLTAAIGSWTGSTPLSYAYQWLQCNSAGESCKELSGATGATLGLISSLVGGTVKVVVTATNSAGSTSATSEPTSIIKALLPGNTSLPSIGGLLEDGQSLTAALGSWTGTTPISYGYQWQECNAAGEACKDIGGATEGALALVSGLVGDTVRVVVTATNSGGSTKAASEPTSVIGALLPGNTGLPSISGLLQDGQSLTAVAGSWTGTSPISYAYQWLQCNSAGEGCKELSGATGATLGLLSSLVGDTVKVVVTATNSGGSTKATSEPTSIIKALLPSNTGLPSIAGLLQDGQSLTAGAGSWTGSTPISYAYQWLQCNSAGESCKEVSGATGATLGLISGLVGDTVKVVVTATNSGGSTKATSEPTSIIKALLPSNASLPSIGGLLEDGQSLTAVAGGWTGTTPISYGYQWQLCNGAGEGCKDISGATEGALALISSFVGDTVRVVVTATNSGGSAKAASEPTSVIGALLPGNTGLPSIVGSLIDGQTLTAGAGSWTGSTPISYAYQWLQCNSAGESCKELSGATGATLGLISGLVGDTVKVVVTATNSGGSTKATSEPTSIIKALLPGNTGLPSIVGSLVDGQSLTAGSGSWTGTAPISYGYQWLQCNSAGESCKELSGATGATLGLISSLVGDTVKVVVTATNAGGSTKATSEPTSVIAALLPGNTGLPSIVGSLIDGQTLTVGNGSWTGTAPISYGYQWLQCNSAGESCKELSGATGATLGLLSTLVGDTVKVVVTATNSGGSTKATSEPTSIIKALLPGNTSLPGIAGSLIDGQTLSAGSGSWTGTAPISYGYQWLQCNSAGESCKEISGATGATFGLISSLVGDTIKVVVTATNSGGSTKATSEPTSVIKALLPGNTSLPSIAGSLIDGQTLSAGNGSWTGTTPISYGYQWLQCNGKGESCTELSGATGATLGLLSSLVGDTVKVVVTATNSGGSTKATSEPTSIIKALLPGNTSLPSIAGLLEDKQTAKGATGSWTGTTPITYSYQWQSCNAKGEECKNLAGKTEETLPLTEALIASTVRLVVKATNSGGSTEAASAPTTAVLAALPIDEVLPKVSGLLKIAETLTAHHEKWGGTQKGISYTYQWQLCGALGLVGECKNIAGATKETFLLELLDAALTLRVGVTAHNERGASETAYSAVTGLIAGLVLSPSKGTAGTAVAVKGADMLSVNTVNFGEKEVLPAPKSEKELVAEAPTGTGTVPVTVSTSEGTTVETTKTQFTYE